MACSGDGFTLLSMSVTICDRMMHTKVIDGVWPHGGIVSIVSTSWEYVLREELLYNRLELVPGVDVKGMMIDLFS